MRRARDNTRSPLASVTLDPDTVEVTLRALTDIETAEAVIRRQPNLAGQPDVTRLLATVATLSLYLRPPLKQAAQELDEIDRPGAHPNRL